MVELFKDRKQKGEEEKNPFIEELYREIGQLTGVAFLKSLDQSDIQISMDGRGKAMDNVFTKRLWHSVKYKEVHINDYQTVPHTKKELAGI